MAERDYVIITDSGSDIDYRDLAKWGVNSVDLTFRFNDEGDPVPDRGMDKKEFYAKMRAGDVSKTAACNVEDFTTAFEAALSQGSDILYLGFSSGLSTTVNSGRIAAEELASKYSESRIVCIDTLCASAGQGLIVWYAVKAKEEGKTLDENAEYVKSLIPNLCHWFTVDDLQYLKRGGRISAASAFAAGVLNIKPVLHVDDEGHLINMQKVRGRSASVKALFDKYEELASDLKGPYFISHGDCLEDALALEDMVFSKYGHKAASISYVGTVIGSHSGPGTLAFFFLGEHR